MPERGANQPVNAESSDDDIRERAYELHGRDGELEIDNDAVVSHGDGTGPSSEGVYVAAWVWVPFEEAS